MILWVMESWPTYYSFREDKYIMKGKWRDRNDRHRIVQRDNTNVQMTEPGN